MTKENSYKVIIETAEDREEFSIFFTEKPGFFVHLDMMKLQSFEEGFILFEVSVERGIYRGQWNKNSTCIKNTATRVTDKIKRILSTHFKPNEIVSL